MTDSYHFIGIGGIGMSGLARILLSRQAQVTGSDLAANATTESLIQSGAHVYKGHSEGHISAKATIVYNTDIKKDNPEYQAALKMGCALMHRSDLLAHLLEGHQTLAVTGTHGKTTTSSLLAAVCVEAGLDPSFAIGGILQQWHTNARFGKGKAFVFEADESDGSFLKYHPFGAIVTNIDRDHLNHFQGSEEVLIEAFNTFMTQVQSTKHLFWCGDDAHLRRLNHSGQTYGLTPGCDWHITDVRQKGFAVYFDLQYQGTRYRDIEVALTGVHNALNAAAVFGLSLTLGIAEEAIRQALRTFKGVKRRCEKKGEKHGVLFLDDYAHHPTEIQATLKAIRQAVKEKRLIAVFQPHRFSRTQDCLGTYGPIFDLADEVIITDIYGGTETPIPGLSSALLLDEIKQASSVSIQYVSRQDLTKHIAHSVQPHDVVVTLGAGDVTQVSAEVLEILSQQSPRCFKLGLVFGGSFTEHEVAIRSATHFRNSLNRAYYDIEEFGITKLGTWIVGSDTKQRLEQLLDKPEQDKAQGVSEEVMQRLQACDVFVPVLHGPSGEDGTIQGFFEMLGKAYSGCDYRACALAMDKVITKKLAALKGLRTAPWIDFSSYQWSMQSSSIVREIEKTLSFPVFIKPIHLGSTVGITKVEHVDQLTQAINYAFRFDTHVLVEQGIDRPREIEFAVLGNDEIQVFPPGEILTGGEVYGYHAKYTPGKAAPTTPRAELTAKLVEEGMRQAEIAYKSIGCCGFARVDFFLDQQGIYWFNEINPIPGFTPFSLYPQICETNGLAASELMDQFVILALQRKRRQNRIDRTNKAHLAG